jgi:peroxiredoxin
MTSFSGEVLISCLTIPTPSLAGSGLTFTGFWEFAEGVSVTRAAFTGVCTTQLCTVRDAIHLYENEKATVLAISVDLPFTLAKFKEDQKLNFTLLSDFNKEVSRSYSAIYEDWILGLKGVSKRAAFVINPEGIVTYAEVLENAGELPNFDKINAAIGD